MSILSVALGFVAVFIFGGLWYGPIVGKKWAAYMGMDMSKKPAAGVMKRAFTLQIVGALLTVTAVNFICYIAFRSYEVEVSRQCVALIVAGVLWAGFQLPLQLSKIAWEMRPWGLLPINAAHDLINLILASQIAALLAP